MRDADGRTVLHLDGDKAALFVGASGNEGDVMVYDADGNLRIHLAGASGEVKLLGVDCAKDFEVRDAATIEPGTVLVIDEAGGLRRSRTAYDRRVAGVVSGAGGLRPGIVLDKQQEGSDRRPVALVGKVFCKVDAAGGAIAIGDLLTTSDTPGHAMRVGDPSRPSARSLARRWRRLPREAAWCRSWWRCNREGSRLRGSAQAARDRRAIELSHGERASEIIPLRQRWRAVE